MLWPERGLRVVGASGYSHRQEKIGTLTAEILNDFKGVKQEHVEYFLKTTKHCYSSRN